MSASNRSSSRASGSTPLRVSCFGVLAAGLAVGFTPLACADNGKDPGMLDAPDTSVIAPSPTEAGAEADAPEAGPCSDSGVCIAPVAVGDFINLTSIWGSSKNDVWAVGTNGTVMHYDGQVWETAAAEQRDASLFTLRSVWLERPDDVWIVDGHSLRHTTGWKGPSATEWKFYDFPLDDLAPAAIRGKGNSIWLARGLTGFGGGSALLELDEWSENGPRTIENIGPSYEFSFVALAMASPTEVWATGANSLIGDPSRIVRASRAPDTSGEPDAGLVWQLEEHDSRTSKQLFGAWADENVTWFVGESGTVRRQTKAAVATKTFEVVESPVQADLYGVFGFGPNDVWAVGEASTVLHWNGTTWSKLATPFDDAIGKPRLLAVWGSSPGDVWIAGHGTLLHFTENAP